MKKILPLLSAGIAALMLVASCGITSKMGIGGKTYTMERLPKNVEQLQALPFPSALKRYREIALNEKSDTKQLDKCPQTVL